MTLIGFVNHGTHVDIATDTGGWGFMERDGMSRVTKYAHLPHLDAVMLRQGVGEVGRVGAHVLELVSAQATFSEVVHALPQVLSRSLDLDDKPWSVGTLFLLGWSEESAAFESYVLASEKGFAPHKVDRTLMPSPWSLRPSALELRRLKAVAQQTDWAAQAVAEWPTRPPFEAPASDQEWIELADLARQERTLSGSRGRVHVTGELWLSRLAQGEFTSRSVHRWDDTGENLRRMVSDSHHPLAQAEPCPCGSGEVWRDCHLAQWNAANGTCLCGSGRDFNACCRDPALP